MGRWVESGEGGDTGGAGGRGGAGRAGGVDTWPSEAGDIVMEAFLLLNQPPKRH